MRLSRRLILAAFVVFGLSVLAPAQDDLKPVRILFAGNSYTHVNDLPKMIAELAKAGGQRPLAQEKETPGGYSLEKHWAEGKAAQKIAAGKWDYVVLQDHSLRPLEGRPLMFEYGHKFDAEIQKQGAATLLYQTWARQKTPERQAELGQAYNDLGRELKARVAPVGTAWGLALKANPGLALHGADGHHPSKAGTYLAACVFYGVVYGRSPEGLPGAPGGLGDADARQLQAMAWKAVQEAAAAK